MAKSDWPALGNIIAETVRVKQAEQATAEVNQMIAGDKINLDDLINLID